MQLLFQNFAPCYEDNPTRKMFLYIGIEGLNEQGLPWEAAYLIRLDLVFVMRLVNSLNCKRLKRVYLFWG